MVSVDLRRPIDATLLRTAPAAGQVPQIESSGGDYNAGILRRVSVITRGEAVGHDLWIDRELLAAVRDAINSRPQGVKSRFTHPSLSADGLGKSLGRFKNASIDGDHVVADLHFFASAHDTPDGNLAAYVIRLASEDPTAFGASIVFQRDKAAEFAFSKAHKNSPDKDNVRNLVHARLKTLRAVDIVDSPAANPSGLFHRTFAIAEEAASLLDFALGITDERPTLDSIALDVDPDRAIEFVRRHLASRGVSICRHQESEKMTAEKEIAALTDESQTPAENVPTAAPMGSQPQEAPAPAPQNSEAQLARETLRQFMAAFGDTNGAKWFAEGLTMDQAKDRHIAFLTAEVDALRKRIAQANFGAKPVSFSDPPDSNPVDQKAAALRAKLGDATGRFAAGIRLPSSNPSSN